LRATTPKARIACLIWLMGGRWR